MTVALLFTQIEANKVEDLPTGDFKALDGDLETAETHYHHKKFSKHNSRPVYTGEFNENMLIVFTSSIMSF